MKNRTRYRNFAQRLRRYRPWLIGLAACLFIALWLTLQHKPGWYQPVEATEDVLRRARRDAPNLADTISEHLVRGAPIEIVLTQTAVNEWLSALPHVWPDARRYLPREITNPAVSFSPGRLRLGAHLEQSGWRAIAGLSLDLSLNEGGDALVVRLSGVQSGSLPVPRALLTGWVNRQLAQLRSDENRMPGGGPLSSGGNPVLAAKGQWSAPIQAGMPTDNVNDVWRRIESADELFDGVRVPNRFVWPNGRREFRLGSMTFLEGEVRISLEPI